MSDNITAETIKAAAGRIIAKVGYERLVDMDQQEVFVQTPFADLVDEMIEREYRNFPQMRGQVSMIDYVMQRAYDMDPRYADLDS